MQGVYPLVQLQSALSVQVLGMLNLSSQIDCSSVSFDESAMVDHIEVEVESSSVDVDIIGSVVVVGSSLVIGGLSRSGEHTDSEFLLNTYPSLHLQLFGASHVPLIQAGLQIALQILKEFNS